MMQTGLMRRTGHYRQLLFVVDSVSLMVVEVLQLELLQDAPFDFVVVASSALIIAALAAPGFWVVPGGLPS